MSDAPTHVAARDGAGHDEATIEDHFPWIVRTVRTLTAVVFAGMLGAVFWLSIMQEGNAGRIFEHTWTSHDFPDGLGNALGADEPARTGLVATVGLGILLTVVFALIERWLPGRGWAKGLAFAPVLFLLWGLVFCPLVDAHQVLEADDFAYRSSGLFASTSGAGTLVSAAVASLATGIVIARVLQLARTPEWWRPHAHTREIVLADPGGGEILEVTFADDLAGHRSLEAETELLELPEQGPEQRGERAR